MNEGTELLKSLINESVQRTLEEIKSPEDYFKNLKEHTEGTKCRNIITQEKSKKDRTFCRNC